MGEARILVMWENIPNNEGYRVSNTGLIESLPKVWVSGKGRVLSHSGKLLSQQMCRQGYLSVKLKGGVRYKTHRLVAMSFIPNPNNKQEVNHKDGNKSNNNVSNLEWVTPSENVIHSLSTGLKKPVIGERHGRSKLKEKDVLFIRNNHHKYTFRYFAKMFNVDASIISDCVKRITWKHI